MPKELVIQGTILLVSLVILFRGIWKLPKKLAIGFTAWIVLSMVGITLACVYYPETVIQLANYFHIDLTITKGE